VAGGQPALCLPTSRAQNYLHHQCNRKPEPGDPKTTKHRGNFPTDDAATKLIYLAIRNFEKAGRCVREWPLGGASIACRVNIDRFVPAFQLVLTVLYKTLC